MIDPATPTWGIAVSAVFIGLGLIVLTARQRGRDRAAGFDRLAGYLLLVIGVGGCSSASRPAATSLSLPARPGV